MDSVAGDWEEQEAQIQGEGTLGEKEKGEEVKGLFLLVAWLQAEMLPEACVRDLAIQLTGWDVTGSWGPDLSCGLTV